MISALSQAKGFFLNFLIHTPYNTPRGLWEDYITRQSKAAGLRPLAVSTVFTLCYVPFTENYPLRDLCTPIGCPCLSRTLASQDSEISLEVLSRES